MSKLAALSVLMRHVTLSSRELARYSPTNTRKPPRHQGWYRTLTGSKTFEEIRRGRKIPASVRGVVVHRGYPHGPAQRKPKPDFWTF